MNRAYLCWTTGETTAEILCEACYIEDGRNSWNRSTLFLGHDVPEDWLCYHRTFKPYTVQFTGHNYHYEGQPSIEIAQ